MSNEKNPLPTKTPHEELAKEAREWDTGVRTPEGFVDSPEAVPYTALKEEFNRLQGVHAVLEHRYDKLQKENAELNVLLHYVCEERDKAVAKLRSLGHG